MACTRCGRPHRGDEGITFHDLSHKIEFFLLDDLLMTCTLLLRRVL